MACIQCCGTLEEGQSNSTWGVGEVLVQGVVHLIWVVRHE